MAFIDDLKRNFEGQTTVNRLIIVNAVVFLLCYTIGLFTVRDAWQEYVALPASVGDLITRPWTVVTHMFSHAGFRHIFFNMLLLFFLGKMFSTLFSSRRLISTYILGGFAGGLAYLIIYNVVPSLNAEHSFALGASAAVMAIVVAVAAFRPKMEIRLFGVFPVKMAVLGGAMVLLDYLQLQSSDNVGGHIGHLGGAAYGVWMGYKMRKTGRFPLADGFERFLDRVFSFNPFKRGPRMKVVQNEMDPRKRYKRDEDFNAEKRSNQEQVDAILDKISKRGYDALTKAEKDFLFQQGDGKK